MLSNLNEVQQQWPQQPASDVEVPPVHFEMTKVSAPTPLIAPVAPKFSLSCESSLSSIGMDAVMPGTSLIGFDYSACLLLSLLVAFLIDVGAFDLPICYSSCSCVGAAGSAIQNYPVQEIVRPVATQVQRPSQAVMFSRQSREFAKQHCSPRY